MTTVDQQRVRRTRTGLVAHDPGRALDGYTLFTPMFGDGTVYLIDIRGEVVHTWKLPYSPGLYGYLLDNGHLFYCGKVMTDFHRVGRWRPTALRGVVALQGGCRARGRLAREDRLGGHSSRSPSRRAKAAQRQRRAVVSAPCPARAAHAHPGRPGRNGDQRHDVRRLSPRDDHEGRHRLGMAKLGAPRRCDGNHHTPGPPGRVDARQRGGGDARWKSRRELPKHLYGGDHRATERTYSLEAWLSPARAAARPPTPPERQI